MDPATYQQLMVQALMGGQNGTTPQGMTGQNPTTPYGSAMVTGNGMQTMPSGYNSQNAVTGQNASSSMLMQPYSSYPNM